jgi:hypothetical protein
MASHYDQKPYYNFPSSGYGNGGNLYDTVSKNDSYTDLFTGSSGPYTVAETLNLTDLLVAPYTYDTILSVTTDATDDTQTTVTGYIFADNYFEFYVNGELVETDPVSFTPHQAVEVNFTRNSSGTVVYAIFAKDYGDAVTGLEYVNSSLGDGSLRVLLSDGTASSSSWKVFTINYGMYRRIHDPLRS